MFNTKFVIKFITSVQNFTWFISHHHQMEGEIWTSCGCHVLHFTRRNILTKLHIFQRSNIIHNVRTLREAELDSLLPQEFRQAPHWYFWQQAIIKDEGGEALASSKEVSW